MFAVTIVLVQALKHALLHIGLRRGIWPDDFQATVCLQCPNVMRELAAFAKMHGILLISVAMPIDRRIVNTAINTSDMVRWHHIQKNGVYLLSSFGIKHFNFTNVESFSGKDDEFLDGLHPSEPALIRIPLKMLEDKPFEEAMPLIMKGALNAKLATATRLEAYRNEF